MRHEHRQMLGVARSWLLACASTEGLDEAHEGRWLMFGDSAIGARVVPVGTQRVLGHNGGGAGLISTRKETEFGEVAGRPAGQFSEPLDAGPDRASASDRLVSKAPSAPRRRGRAHPASREMSGRPTPGFRYSGTTVSLGAKGRIGIKPSSSC